MKYKYLLFDADNTLFDFDMAEHETFRETCSVFGIGWSEEIYRKYSEINAGFWKMLERGEITAPELRTRRFRVFLDWCGYTGNALPEEINARYLGIMGQQRFLIPHAEEVCRLLADTYPLYIVTNGMKAAQESRMAGSVLQPYFRRMYISEVIGANKPDLAFFEYVLQDIGDPDKANYLVIGDSLSSDIDGAAAAGLDCVWFSPKAADAKGRVPTYTVHELPELLSIL